MCESARCPDMVTLGSRGQIGTAGAVEPRAGRPADEKALPKTISQGPKHCPINSAKATGVWRQIRPK